MSLPDKNLLLLPILLPAVAGLVVLLFRGRASALNGLWAMLATAANLAVGIYFFGKADDLSIRWASGFDLEFALRLYQFSGFILLAAAGFSFLVALYSLRFMRDRPHLNQYYGYLLISLAMVNGAVLADHLVVLLFFWEGLLATLFGLFAIGRPGAWKTAV
jgi:NADH:ubiquinone oxidoreductase subunit 5 (subunit L)/multisubunit Na+/H+ antiporter MnhA subunit